MKGPFRRLSRRMSAYRRYRLPEPEAYDVIVDPAADIEILIEAIGPTTSPGEQLSGLLFRDKPKRRERYELLQLCAPVIAAENEAEIAAMVNSARTAFDFDAMHKRMEELRKNDLRPLHIGVEQALAELDRRGYEPADGLEFLSFLAQYPEAVRRPRDIYALGAIDRRGEEIRVLSIHDRPNEGTVRIDLTLMQSPGMSSCWIDLQRFLARRKKVPA